MQEHLGRKLEHTEIVHHINGNKLDNRIENLEVMRLSDHLSYHKKGANKCKNGWAHKYEKCIKCGTRERKHRGRGLCTLCYSREYEQIRPPRIK